ncbi:MAG: hypothetical protein AM325_004525 [Candidatus Thorarchaeota archaeon SMTZ1-45]|nr:MAG: hypothetical protein AM325_06280 [Candidatus Thorarchaeota archaeon SMTZ1-45]
MRIRKWLMKQQWRIVQIRGIWSLFYGILLLAIAYFEFIPFFAAMGTFGPFVFAGILLFLFLILGYIYDRVLVMWAPSQEVTMERNPYQYVPSPKEHIFWFPLYSVLLDSVEKVAQKFDVDTDAIDAAREYYSELEKMSPAIKEDLDRALDLRLEFMSKNPFWESDED